MKGQGKLNMHIIYESMLMLFVYVLVETIGLQVAKVCAFFETLCIAYLCCKIVYACCRHMIL